MAKNETASKDAAEGVVAPWPGVGRREMIPLKSLTLDREWGDVVQCRADWNDGIAQGSQEQSEFIQGLVDAYKLHLPVPPIVVFEMPNPEPPTKLRPWPLRRVIVNGYHRKMARQAARFDDIEAIIYTGTMDDALRYAAGANHDNGKSRTPADKFNAVKMLLTHPRHSEESDTTLAEWVHVSQPFVTKVREQGRAEGWLLGEAKRAKNGKSLGGRSSTSKATAGKSDDPKRLGSSSTPEHSQQVNASSPVSQPQPPQPAQPVHPAGDARTAFAVPDDTAEGGPGDAGRPAADRDTGAAVPDAPLYTDFGQLVPAGLRGVFTTAAALKKLSRQVGDLRGGIERVAAEPGGDGFTPSVAVGHCRDLQSMIDGGRPVALCPVCDATGEQTMDDNTTEQCRVCEGHCYLRFFDLPKLFKTARRKLDDALEAFRQQRKAG